MMCFVGLMEALEHCELGSGFEGLSLVKQWREGGYNRDS
jgi:hypothetical protein